MNINALQEVVYCLIKPELYYICIEMHNYEAI